MAKTKLERAVENRVSSLNEAQREIVMAQLAVYRRNGALLSQVESELNMVSSKPTTTMDELRAKQATRAALSHEINQISTANSQIAAELFKFLEE